jgi:hypothetical protein
VEEKKRSVPHYMNMCIHLFFFIYQEDFSMPLGERQLSGLHELIKEDVGVHRTHSMALPEEKENSNTD